MNQRVLRLPKNEVGRDFIAGDIHFKTIELHRALHKLGFDSSKDRLIGVGDLIDRGPGVMDGLKLLGEPWFFTVKGNHELMLVDAYRTNPDFPYSNNGARWWQTIQDESKAMIIAKLESLPTIIEIESPRGLVGVVHADVRSGTTWPEFVQDIENPQVEEVALWGRERVKKHHRQGISGVWTVCTGHTWVPNPLRLGNVLALDCTGGGDGPLAIYCPQDDTIYVDGRSVSLDQTAVVTELLGKLEQSTGELKATTHANKLIESQSLSKQSHEIAQRASTAWVALEQEISEHQELINALHGLSLVTGDRRADKLKELKARYAGTQIELLLTRLFA
jgi:serine/threonine protein phosphatase 1